MILLLSLQLTVYGVNLMNGEDAAKLVVKVSEREREEWYNLQTLAESYAQGILQNHNLAT